MACVFSCSLRLFTANERGLSTFPQRHRPFTRTIVLWLLSCWVALLVRQKICKCSSMLWIISSARLFSTVQEVSRRCNSICGLLGLIHVFWRSLYKYSCSFVSVFSLFGIFRGLDEFSIHIAFITEENKTVL